MIQEVCAIDQIWRGWTLIFSLCRRCVTKICSGTICCKICFLFPVAESFQSSRRDNFLFEAAAANMPTLHLESVVQLMIKTRMKYSRWCCTFYSSSLRGFILLELNRVHACGELIAWRETFWNELIYTKKNPAAIACLKKYDLSLPMVYDGRTTDELRIFTHQPNCTCYNCMRRPYLIEIEEDVWERECTSVTIYDSWSDFNIPPFFFL